MVQVESIEIGPSLVGVEIGKDGPRMVGKDVLAGDDLRDCPAFRPR